MPKNVVEEITRIQRRFFWCGKGVGKVCALVKWDVIQRPKNKGGLGVGDLEIKNNSLLFKWWWRYCCEEGSLWKTIIRAIHKEYSSLLPRNSKTLIAGPWKDVKDSVQSSCPASIVFRNNMRINLGDGTNIKFWEDRWLSSISLKEVYPTLFAISSQQNNFIANVGWHEGPIWRWTLSWCKELNVVELGQLAKLSSELELSRPYVDKMDNIAWKEDVGYTVRENAAQAQELKDTFVQVDHLVCSVWKKVAPPKIELMLWLALQDKLNTKEKLVKKGILPPCHDICTFCNEEGESLNHILVHCKYTWKIWYRFGEKMRRVVPLAESFKKYYEVWTSQHVRSKTLKKFWNLIFFAITWSLWNLRNLMIFENKEFDEVELVKSISWRVVIWSKAWVDGGTTTSQELARNINLLPLLYGN